MAAISFPVTGLQPVTRDQPAPAPAETGGPRPVDPNHQDAPQGDTVTLSATFPPAQAAQPSAIVKLQEFSLFIAQTDVQTGQPAAPDNIQVPAQAPAPAPQAFAQAAAPVPTAEPNPAAFNQAANQAGVAATPQEELAQLDQTLQRLGIDPHSISLFNRLGLLLYANDPAALQNLVHALQEVDQQLGQLGQLGAANNAANQTPGPAQDLLPPALQARQQVPQGAANFVPEPVTHLQGTAPAQAPAAAPAQLEGENQNPVANTRADVFAVQLSFSDFQGTIQQQTAPAQGTPSNPPPANGAPSASSAQTNNLFINFQELQLSFQATEFQAPQQQAPGPANPASGRPELNVRF